MHDSGVTTAAVGRLVQRLGGWLEATLGLVMCAILFVLMLLTFFDVIGRYFFNTPIPAAFELTELGMGVIVFLGLPLVTLREEHISITLLDGVLRKGHARIQNVAVNLFITAMLVFLAWRIFENGQYLLDANETSTFLRIAIAPFAFFMSLMAMFSASLLLLLTISRDVLGGYVDRH